MIPLREHLRLLLLLPALLLGCESGKQDMYDQPRYKPFSAGPLFADGASARLPPAGIQLYAGGVPAGISSGRAGRDQLQREQAAEAAPALPGAISWALLQRGRQRYEIYCLPCHSPVGDGDGLVVRRGFPAPPSFHQDRLRQAPDRHLFDVISQGYGVMAAYGDRVPPSDRWAIVAYLRALQLSQHAPVARLSESMRRQLPADAGKGAQ